MEAVIAELELNIVSVPVETDAGSHLVLVTERSEGELASLEEMRDQLLESGIDWVPVSKLVTQGYRPGEEKISSLPGSGSVD